ncbi:MAG TPA: amidohydrolase family protein, partial [Candidatus Saccharimonadales bacterium]|nr:amidohydrolase family protein [Candidatus Saccharimonadales bacterium]
GWAHNLVGAVGWSRITVGTVAGAADRSAEGMDLDRLGAATGLDPFDAVSDLMLAAEGNVSQIIHGISGEAGDDEGIRMLVADPTGAFCTDANDTGRGRPHPAAYGAFPRVLGEWVRERGVLTLEEAIRKMTGAPAAILGLRDRGILREGAAADLVVLDPAAVGSRATWEEPRRLADGIGSVLVNGRVVVRDGRLIESGAGVILRREG